PVETDIVAVDGPFEPTVKPTRPTFLGRLQSSFRLGTLEELLQKGGIVLFVVVGTAILMRIYRRRGAVTAALTAIVGTIVIVLLALALPALQPARRNAA